MRATTMTAAVLLGAIVVGTVQRVGDRDDAVTVHRDAHVAAQTNKPSRPVPGRPGFGPAGVSATSATFSFAPMQKYQPMSGGGYVTFDTVGVGDVNGDRRDDLVAATWNTELYIFLQDAQGGLAPPRVATNNFSSEFVLVDLNEDGVLDIASRNLLLSDGLGGFKFGVGPSGFGEVGDWTALDVDRDGHMDMVGFQSVADYSGGTECGQWPMNYCPRYRVAYGNGMGGFSRVDTVKLGQPYFISGAGAHDLNGDGFGDLAMVLTGDPFRPGKVLVQYSDGRSGLLPPVEVHRGYDSGGGITFGDFNGDARVDSVMGTEVRLRDQAGAFAAPYVLPAALMRANWPLAADFDGDGRDDLASVQMVPVSMGFTVHVALNLQRNGLLQIPQLTEPQFEYDKFSQRPHGFASGDLNGDGCRDLVIAAAYEGVLILHGRDCIPRPKRQHKIDERGFRERLTAPATSAQSAAVSGANRIEMRRRSWKAPTDGTRPAR